MSITSDNAMAIDVAPAATLREQALPVAAEPSQLSLTETRPIVPGVSEPISSAKDPLEPSRASVTSVTGASTIVLPEGPNRSIAMPESSRNLVSAFANDEAIPKHMEEPHRREEESTIPGLNFL